MWKYKSALIVFHSILFYTVAVAQVHVGAAESKGLSIRSIEGDTVRTNLGRNIVLNRESTLRRVWYTIKDDSAPAQISEPTGVGIYYSSDVPGTPYSYQSVYSISPSESLSAFEIRFMLVDVFGESIRTLSAIKMVDMKEKKEFVSAWRVINDSEVSRVYSTIAYIAKVRTEAGKVYEINESNLLKEILKITAKVSGIELKSNSESYSRP